MACCHYYAPTAEGDTAFSVDTSAITFGWGCLSELGDRAAGLGLKRVALMTDAGLRELEHFAVALGSLK
jgi:hydroxyacid-oxoacid transhydrogenase